MTDDEIGKVVSDVLRDRFTDLGFERSTVKSEQDFDGSSILRVTAHFKNGELPTKRMIDAVQEIRSELITRGEERFVFLDSDFPGEEIGDEDEDTE
jgi:hypothetical protein